MIKSVISNLEKYPNYRVEQKRLLKYCKSQIPNFSQKADYWKRIVPKDKRLLILKRYHNDSTSIFFKLFGKFDVYIRIASLR